MEDVARGALVAGAPHACPPPYSMQDVTVLLSVQKDAQVFRHEWPNGSALALDISGSDDKWVGLCDYYLLTPVAGLGM